MQESTAVEALDVQSQVLPSEPVSTRLRAPQGLPAFEHRDPSESITGTWKRPAIVVDGGLYQRFRIK